MLKGLVAWWGRNPVAGNLLMIFCVIAGVFSFNQMEKEFWPPGRDDGVMVNAEQPDLRLNRLGLHAAVLGYRVWPWRHPAPLHDARQAIRLVRAAHRHCAN